jgi:alkanesulfonate monooxygenase SsuD/methylene tetrahydromethanopterin reductase-like flavin-dependent oxidoreductase (luciferase family)
MIGNPSWVSKQHGHSALPAGSGGLEGYPYEGGLRYTDGGRKPYLQPVVLHGSFAAATVRVKLSHCVMLAPLRPAVLLAKQLANKAKQF